MSVEDRLSSIERQYKEAYEMLCKMATYPTSYRSKPNYVAQTLKKILSLQRMLELLYEDVRKLKDEKTAFYVERCEKNVKIIGDIIRGVDSICTDVDLDEFSSAFRHFKLIRSLMYQIIEDVRLIYALKLYPIQEKIALKSLLTDLGFLEVTKCLDEAETNFAEKHFKDAIDRAREALEKTVTSILSAIGKKPSGYFSTDIGTLSSLRIIDKETKKLTEATYSYLSEAGAHGRVGDLTSGDAHYALKETYMRIDILLKKYSMYSSKKDNKPKAR